MSLEEEARKRAAAQVSPAYAELERQLAAARQRTQTAQTYAQTGYEGLANRAPGQEALVNEIFGGARRGTDAAYSSLQNEIQRIYGGDQARQESNAARMGLSAAVTDDTRDRGSLLSQLNSTRQASGNQAMEMLRAAFSSSARNQGEIAKLSGQSAVQALARQLMEQEGEFGSQRAEIAGQEAGLTNEILSGLLRAQQEAEESAQSQSNRDRDYGLSLAKFNLDANKASRGGSGGSYKGQSGARQMFLDLGYSPKSADENMVLLNTILQAHGQKGVQRKFGKTIPGPGGKPIADKRFETQRKHRADEGEYGKAPFMGTDDPEVLAEEVRFSAQRRGLNPTDTQTLIEALYALLGK